MPKLPVPSGADIWNLLPSTFTWTPSLNFPSANSVEGTQGGCGGDGGGVSADVNTGVAAAVSGAGKTIGGAMFGAASNRAYHTSGDKANAA